MNEEEHIELQLGASQWACGEADKLIKKWKACKTAHARNKLISTNGRHETKTLI